MLVFDKHKIREQVNQENIFILLQDWGGDPEYTSFGVLCHTICHNPPGVGSKKLYYYSNTDLFRCYTGCENSTFDIFELLIKVAKIQWNKDFDLDDAVRWISNKFNISGTYEEDATSDELEDWKYLANYQRIQEIEPKNNHITLKEYDETILSRFNYMVKIEPWLKEGIDQSILSRAKIGFYPGGDQITIPHYDADNRFIGLRGRTLCAEEGELYGKYRPIKVNGLMYNHPLGMNLYNLNHSKNNITKFKKAIVMEGEKSALLYRSYFGDENDISVACCGSSISSFQMQQLLEAGAQEIIIGFDRQFKEIGDDEFKRLKNNLLKIKDRYHQDAIISFIFDKHMITDYKSSPIDHGPNTFMKLYKERLII